MSAVLSTVLSVVRRAGKEAPIAPTKRYVAMSAKTSDEHWPLWYVADTQSTLARNLNVTRNILAGIYSDRGEVFPVAGSPFVTRQDAEHLAGYANARSTCGA